MSGQVYAVVGAKGGVGKTTTSINLGASLARAGYETVVAELDLAMANLVDFLDLDVSVTEATTLHDVLAGEAPATAACYEAPGDLSVAVSGTTIDGYAEADLSRLPAVLEELRWHYDVIILDTPAGCGEAMCRPLQLADEALVVCTPRVASVRNAQNTLGLADRAGTDVRGLILTKSGTGRSPGPDRIAEFLDVGLLGHVPEDEAVPGAQDNGLPVVVDQPRCPAASAYREVTSQLVGAISSPSTGSAGNGSGADPTADSGSPEIEDSEFEPAIARAADGGDLTPRRDEATSEEGARAEQAGDADGSDTARQEETDDSDRTDVGRNRSLAGRIRSVLTRRS